MSISNNCQRVMIYSLIFRGSYEADFEEQHFPLDHVMFSNKRLLELFRILQDIVQQTENRA